MSAASVHHPIFARVFDRLIRLMERGAAEHRRDLLAGLSGRVLELGIGNGMNFQHYPATVREVVAVEPEPYLRGKAEQAARRAPVPVTVRDGRAEHLPLEDRSFDAAVASLVLCSVRDQERSLAELRRVLEPGGDLRFFEHVRSTRRHKAGLQQRLDRWGIWPSIAGGCHSARDTVGAIAAAGFAIEHVREFHLAPEWSIIDPHVLGIARSAPTGVSAATLSSAS